MKKIISICLCVYVFLYSAFSPRLVYADWASPFIKTFSKSFSYNNIQYTVQIVDVMSSSKAATLLSSALRAGVSKVAIPLNFLGWVGIAASAGYMVYEMSSVLQSFKTSAYGMPVTSGVAYACPSSSGQGGYSWAKVNSQSIQYGTYSVQGTFPRWNIYFVNETCSGIIRSYVGVATSDIRIYSEKVYMAQECSVSLQTACSSAVPYPYTDTDVKNWVSQNPSPFSSLQPTVSSSKPVDAVEVSPSQYPDVTAKVQPVQSTPQPEQEQQTEKPLPQPSTEQNYIDPSQPQVPQFDVSLDVPEKKSISDLVRRWLSSIPFIGAFSKISISAGGSCSVAIPVPFSSSSASLNFCQYSNVFEIIGGFIFSFASIYAVYIIFKRSD